VARTLALIAHDARKDDLVAFASRRRADLERFALLATGTTGGRIAEATGLPVERMLSGPLGGDVQIGARLVNGEVAGVLFLRDPMTAHPHEPDIQALLKLCDIHGVPLATNLATAELVLDGLLRDLDAIGSTGGGDAAGSSGGTAAAGSTGEAAATGPGDRVLRGLRADAPITAERGDLDDDVRGHLAGPLGGEPVSVGDVTLDVHVAGPDGGEVVLLVAGLGMQRIAWPPELLAALHDAGYRTVAADNRDVGRSTVLSGGVDDLARGGGHGDPPYHLATMAADLVGVLDHLGIERAHVVGLSMGGMVAQHLALDAPDRVASLSILMSSTGDRAVGGPRSEARWVLTTPPPRELDAYVEHALAAARAVGSPERVDEARVRAQAQAAHERGVHPEGAARQLAAILGGRDLTPRLADVSAPTLVVHGREDRLVDPSGGRALAAAIPDAELVEIADLGHDLPVALLDAVTRPLLEHLRAHPA
jgi:methylglyoxal synthase